MRKYVREDGQTRDAAPHEAVIHAAIVAFVHGPTLVNLIAFDCGGNPYAAPAAVFITHPNQVRPEYGGWCEPSPQYPPLKGIT